MAAVKRLICAVLCVLISVSLLTGCRDRDSLSDGAGSWLEDRISYKGEAGRIMEESGKIMRCIKEKDKEGMKLLFCEKVRNTSGFDEQIDSIFDFIDSGDTWSYDIKTTAGGGQSVSGGEVTDWDVHPEIRDIQVAYDRGNYFDHKYYSIDYYWHIVCEDDKSLEGIQYMRIELLNVETLEIGEYVG